MHSAARAHATIDLDRLAANLRAVRSVTAPGTQVLAVVKANAYGHGSVPVARRLVQEGVAALGVACPEEGVALRREGIEAPIVILGSARLDESQAIARAGLEVAVESRDLALELDRAARGAGTVVGIHVHLDTGMGRLGLDPRDLARFLAFVSNLPGLVVRAVMSHLSSADDPSQEARAFTVGQLARFDAAVAEARTAGLAVPATHVLNSAGVLYHGPTVHDLVRPGLALYGIHPHQRSRAQLALEPVMEVRVEIFRVRDVAAATPLSYDRQFTTTRPSRIAVLPLGYADGLPVALTNRGQVWLHGRRAPIVGRVTMDMTLVDVTDVPDARPGDEVVIFGSEPGAPGVDEVAAWAGTIPYEILCGIGSRVERVAVGAGARPDVSRGARHALAHS